LNNHEKDDKLNGIWAYSVPSKENCHYMRAKVEQYRATLPVTAKSATGTN